RAGGSAGAIKGATRSTLDGFDAFDVLDLDARKSAAAGLGELVVEGDTVDDVDRRRASGVSRDRCRRSQHDRWTGTRAARLRQNVRPGNFSGESGEWAARRNLLQVLCVHRAHRERQLRLLGCSGDT